MQYKARAFLYDFSSKVFCALQRSFGAAVVRHGEKEYGIIFKSDGEDIVYTTIRDWDVFRWQNETQYKQCSLDDFLNHYTILEEVLSLMDYGKRIQLSYYGNKPYSTELYKQLSKTEKFTKSVKRAKKDILGYYSQPAALRGLPDVPDHKLKINTR